MSSTSLRIVKHRFSEPSRNLPTFSSRGAESRLTYRFAQKYLSEFLEVGQPVAVAREIPANGYGIADLVSVTWNGAAMDFPIAAADFVRIGRPRLRAFEVKVRNWRQGLLQANRYRSFADVSILVIAAKNAVPAIKFIETFRLLKVGLWTFETSTGEIVRHYTPRPKRGADVLQRDNVLVTVANATKALQVF